MKVFGLFSTIILVLLSLAFINGCDVHFINTANEKSERTVEISSDFNSGLKLIAETSNGAIIVTGTDQQQCDVNATITARSFSLEEAQVLAEQTQIRFENIPQGLHLIVDRPKLKSRESVNVTYKIQVPRQTALKLQSSNGKITAEQIEKSIEASTSNGKIEIASAAGNITAHTSNGSIVIRQAPAPSLDLHTSNGSIQCDDISGDLTASTSNGSVGIHYAPDAEPDKIHITTSNGSINLVTPKDYSARIDAATSNGTIHASVPIEGQRNSKTVNGTIRGGNGQLYLRTSNSSITIN